MANKFKMARLGQAVFFVLKGEVVRTMVGSVSKEGYSFLDGRCPQDRHWFDYDQAVTAADVSLGLLQETLRKRIKALSRKRNLLKTAAYQDRVMNNPRRVEDLRDTDRPARTKHIKKIRMPEPYLSPGQVVYLAVGPLTRAEDGPLYRPYDYFVLETEVRTVTFHPSGALHYALAAPFAWFEFFPTREVAADSLRTAAKLPGSEVVHFVSKDEYQTESAKMDTIPF